MKHVALIFAGGTGTRMNSKTKPKQFLELNGKPIIIHTIEHFEYHEQIEAIVVVCIEGWIPYFRNLLERYNIKKVKWVVPGGANGQESIYNGLEKLHEVYQDEPVGVLIHDGVRPLINEQLISDNIASVEERGNAITVTNAIETIITTDENKKIDNIIDRTKCSLARAPQSFVLQDIYGVHRKAIDEGRNDFIDSASIMRHYGYELYCVDGPTENIKITTPSDFYIFRAIYEAKENSQIFGI